MSAGPRTATGRKMLAIYGSQVYDDVLAIEDELLAALDTQFAALVSEWRKAAALTVDDAMRLVAEGMADEVETLLGRHP